MEQNGFKLLQFQSSEISVQFESKFPPPGLGIKINDTIGHCDVQFVEAIAAVNRSVESLVGKLDFCSFW